MNHSTGELKGQCFISKQGLLRFKTNKPDQEKLVETSPAAILSELQPVKQEYFGEQFIFVRRYPYGCQTKQPPRH